jgi:signal transduction histidine kinase
MLKHASIKTRLILLITSVSCSAVLLTTIAVTLIGIHNLRENLLAQLQETANVVGNLNQAYVTFNQEDTASRNLQQVFGDKRSIIRACMYDAGGNAAANYFGTKVKDKTCPLIAGLPDGINTDREGVVVIKHLSAASIVLESDLSEIESYVSKQVIIAILVAVIISYLAYIFALGLQRTISGPILELADTARRVSNEKDYSLRAADDANNESVNNEMVTLISAFNSMLDEIQERDQQLLKKNEELMKAKDAAESANRAKSHFLANISHELRTPLNAIIGFSSILINQLFGALGHEKYLEYSHDINDAGVQLLDTINDILDLSKAEAGRLALVFEEVHIERAITKCITIMSVRAAESNITITTDIPKHLPYIVADRLRFIQIVLNVLSNAVKFTPDGGKVHIAVKPEMRGGIVTDFIVTVKDTGIGMAKENIPKVFQSFGQIDSGLNRRYEGTGLGLPLTKKLVELHHGNITLDSELGRGTTVTLHFIANPTFISELLNVADSGNK